MILSQLLKDIEFEILQGDINCEVADLVYDSRKITEKSVFVCLVGANVDGHSFINQAVDKGAAVVVVERKIDGIPNNMTVVKVENTRRALAFISAAYFGYPANELVTIGLTGTKGKTTTTHMIKSALEAAGNKTGVIGTTGILIGGEFIPTKNTTPESYEIQKTFRQMVDSGCKYAVMEASSQGLKYDRVAGINFDIGVFTNLSPDHIGPNEHDSMEDYIASKSILFRNCKTAVVNADDENVDAVLSGHTCKIVRCAINNNADLKAENIEFIKEDASLGMRFKTSGVVNCEFLVHTPGMFSVYNSLVAICICNILGVDNTAIAEGLKNVSVCGRVELVPCSPDFSVIIDYAHNAVSTQSILNTLAEYKPNRMICVYGSGGNRSKLRRYDVGEVTGAMADLCILTSDNPRFEEVKDINNDIKIGLARSNGKYIEIEDRKQAIKYAIQNAQKGDFIVLLGKGHETYQEIKGVRYHFDEHEAVAEIKEELGL